MAAAKRLFATKGFHQTAMSELAAQAAISIGQIYRLFANKSEIIVAIVQEDASQRICEMTAIAGEVDAGKIEVRDAIMLILMGEVDRSDEALSFEILAEGHRSDVVAQTIGQLCETYRAVLRGFALRANPALDGEAQEAAEELLLACMFGLGHRALSRSRLSARETARRTAGMIYAALRQGVETV